MIFCKILVKYGIFMKNCHKVLHFPYEIGRAY